MRSDTGSTRDLAAWVVGRRTAPSPRAVELATLSIIDTLACALAGTSEHGPWALKATRDISDDLPSSLFGMGGAATPRDAAMLNGMLAHMLDYDDGDMVSRGHPSCILVPAILAVAESRRMGGAAVLDAYLTGYHVIQLIGRIAGKPLARRGFHVTGLTGVIGATAGLSRLLNLSVDQCATALGFAATTAGGLRANFGTDMKPYHAGRAASCAVEAVEAIIAGVTASSNILEAKDGFLSVLADPSLVPLLRTEIVRLLNGEYSIEAEPPNIKLFACCHSSHPNIAALLSIRPQIIDRMDEIREIVAEAPTTSALYLTHARPRSGLEGKFSMEGALATALVDGKAGVAQFTDEAISRPAIQALLQKVVYRPTERMEEIHIQNLMPGNVTVALNAGTLFAEVRDARGCRSDPCGMADVAAKFRECAEAVLDQGDCEAVLGMLANFDEVPDVAMLMRHLRGAGSSSLASPVI